ncbi:MAG: AAA family ATPase [Peptoniphilus sp.]|uniref:AAA family ATPase n=1 Tax=Peptoniphilus sp. TaxID=1971214 RepID=UPI002A74C90D|nr:AAA family ATPase [Peptoniphilus sp.]MDY2986950.1 AAA family ATPase [Peptoniphilus sp.]
MIYITSIEIKNFQSHENTKLDLHRGLNVIVGRSDSGKTAILRAIKWVFYNDPPPGNLIRNGAKEMSVRIEFNTGAVVTRLWNSKENKYILVKSNGEEIILEKFNRSVPFEVIQEINIQKVELGSSVKTGINISEQLDGPFLLTESSSTRASAIGRLIGVNFIDDALRDVIKDNKNNSKKIKEAELEKEILEKDLQSFDYLKDEEKKLNFIKKCRNEILNYTAQRDKLRQLSSSKLNIQDEIIYLEKKLKEYENIFELEQKFEILSRNLEILKEYSKLSNNIKSNKKDIFTTEEQVLKLKNIDTMYDKLLILTSVVANFNKLNSLSQSIKDNEIRIGKGIKYLEMFNNIDENLYLSSKLENNLNLYSKLLTIRENLNNINSKINVLDVEINDIHKNVLNLSEEYENIFSELGYCPLCHRKINSLNIKEHLRGEI